MKENQWIEEFLLNPRDFVEKFFHQGKYYQKIKAWHENNKKRKKPRAYYVFTLDSEDAKRNATFSTFEFGIKEHMVNRALITKIAGFLPMNTVKENLLRLSGVKIEENVFIAPEITIDPVFRGWVRFRKGASIGWGVKFFNHLFEENGKVIVGYIDIGEDASVGGFVSIAPGVIIGKKVSIGAEVKIAPGVTIGDNAKIGATSFISPFTTIGEGAEVTFGSVVFDSVPPYTKVLGNPAKIVGSSSREKKPKLDLIINPNIEVRHQQ